MPTFISALSGPPRTRAAPHLSLARRIVRATRKIGVALQVRAERRMLMKLDDMALKDLGFNKGLADQKSTRGFWDIPVDRLR